MNLPQPTVQLTNICGQAAEDLRDTDIPHLVPAPGELFLAIRLVQDSCSWDTSLHNTPVWTTKARKFADWNILLSTDICLPSPTPSNV